MKTNHRVILKFPSLIARPLFLFINHIPSLQIHRPLRTLPHPLLQLVYISRSESALERFRICCQARGDGITLQGIQNGTILRLLGGIDVKRCNQSDERSIQLSIR